MSVAPSDSLSRGRAALAADDEMVVRVIPAGAPNSNSPQRATEDPKPLVPRGWIGVDLDGTLAHYPPPTGAAIGPPVPAMLLRVRRWLVLGELVKIVTARVGPQKDVNDAIRAREDIVRWCLEHLGVELRITATKDFAMRELWDDRCVQVEANTGRRLDGVRDLD